MPLNLESLLSALREAGLRVGVTEVLRLQRVFSLLGPAPDGQDPGCPPERLKSLVRAVIVKRHEDRAVFERVFNTWLTLAWRDLEALAEPLLPVEERVTPVSPRSSVASPKEKRRPTWLILIGVVCLVIVAGLGVLWMYETEVVPVKPVTEADKTIDEPKPPPDETLPPDHPRNRTLDSHYVPEIEIVSATPIVIALGILALLTAGGLWRVLSRQRWLPEPKHDPTRPGPPRVFLSPPALAGPQLLDHREQETLVWGIGRFMADEPTRRLDLTATVNATARAGGFPELRFERAWYQREVWLWLDEAAEDSAIRRLADEVEATLQSYGLPVERASFRGTPEHLVTASGAVFAPREIDERRDVALVAVLTDGRMLSRQYRAADDRRVRIDALLRGLSHWPRLAFVDFSDGSNGLAGILAPHDLALIAPPELAAFLGGSPVVRSKRFIPRDDEVWAAACALSPGPVDEDTALLLRQALKLATSPWALRALRAEALGLGGRLQWPPTRRVRYLNWLSGSEADTSGGIPADGTLAKALDFWEQCHRQELKERAGQDAAVPWEDTPAERYLRMELALIRLWRHPGAAIRELYQLCQGRLDAAIRGHMKQLAPRGRGGTTWIELPWSWAERSGPERAMLQAMDFGGGMATEQLRRPGRLWVGVGACLGFAAGGLLVALLRPAFVALGPPTVEHGDKPAPYLGHWVDPEPTEEGKWRVSVTSPKAMAYREVEAEKTVRVTWKVQPERPCVERTEDGAAEVWRCGYEVDPPRLPDDIERSLFVLRASLENPQAEELAIVLLDSGSADLVLIDPEWPEHRKTLMGEHARLGPKRQLIVIFADEEALSSGERMALAGGFRAWMYSKDLSQLAGILGGFQGQRSLGQVWTGDVVRFVLEDHLEQILLLGLSDCQAGQKVTNQGVTFVQICPGTFMMGSPKDEKGRYGDEDPLHEVTVSYKFWLAETETTNAQFRRFRQGHTGEDDLPAVNVTWNDAKAFCENQGWRLASEAEWEYAVRAGTTTRWSFGDDEKQLGDYAWYSGNSNRRAHPVATRKPNSWGLFDMHGNVYEWVQDCWHDNYKGAPDDGSAWQTDKCQFRVLRGGAFGVQARFLRSAVRIRSGPGDKFGDFGFRCARGPRRQLDH